jgi:hypothetical protein
VTAVSRPLESGLCVDERDDPYCGTGRRAITEIAPKNGSYANALRVRALRLPSPLRKSIDLVASVTSRRAATSTTTPGA